MSDSRRRVLYRQSDFPIFQNRMYETADEALDCPRADIVLVQHPETGQVHNAAFDPGIMLYDRHYQNEQAVSQSFRLHLDEVASIVERGLGQAELIEIGCGKGFFLELLAERGIDMVGFDPAYEGENSRILKRRFDGGSIQAKGIVLRHVLEHIQDPFGFLRLLRTANQGEGRVYIEVPCLDWILGHRAWFDIFYEHVNYFRLADFKEMFGVVHEARHLFGGQYLGIVAELGSLRSTRVSPCSDLSFPEDFSRVEFEEWTSGGPVAIWGGASKGVIFALLRQRVGHPVDVVIDINPSKQGRFLPATGLRVMSPEEALPMLPPGSSIYVMNSVYLEEIKKMSGNRYRYIEVEGG